MPTLYISHDIGYLGSGDFSVATDSSFNGSVIVGYSNLSPSGDAHAFRWTAATGMVDLGTIPGAKFSQGLGCSDDGNIIVGYSGDISGPPTSQWWHAFRWTAATGMVDLGMPAGASRSTAQGISADGSTIIGGDAGNASENAWYWRAGTGFVSLGNLGYYFSCALGCNGDGSIIVGNVNVNNLDIHAFRWTVDTGMVDLGTLTGAGNSEAFAISLDNNVIVGQSFDSSGSTAVSWTSGGITPIGFPSGSACAVSSDGSVIAGSSSPDSYLWTAGGIVPLSGGFVAGLSSNGLVPVGTIGHVAGYWAAIQQWKFTSKFSAAGEGGVGDVWMDQRYIDFSDTAIRRRFINADKTWVDLGYYGEFAYDTVETYPLVWNSVHFEQDPTDFLYGWGQNGYANPWSVVATGNDPATDAPYPDMAFDECKAPPQLWKITSKYSAPDEGGIGDLWMDQQYVDFSNPTTRQRFINADKTWVDFGFYGEKPLGTYPLVWNTVQSRNDPTDFIYGYGQHGGAPEWSVVATGNDPTTNEPYPEMAFDVCLAPLPPTQPVAMLN